MQSKLQKFDWKTLCKSLQLVAGYNNDTEGWKGDNACHDYGVSVSKKPIPTETKTDIIFRSFLKRVSLPNQSAVEPLLEFNTDGRRPTVVL